MNRNKTFLLNFSREGKIYIYIFQHFNDYTANIIRERQYSDGEFPDNGGCIVIKTNKYIILYSLD